MATCEAQGTAYAHVVTANEEHETLGEQDPMGFFDRFFGRKSRRVGQAWHDPLDVAVLTTREVIDGKLPVVLVIHDEGVGGGWGGWQFLDAKPLEGREPVAISKEDILKLDPSLTQVTDLQVGWCASRRSKDSLWHRGLIAESTEAARQDDSKDGLPAEARELLDQAVDEFNQKMGALDTIWKFNEVREWHFDVETGAFTMELRNGAEVAADGYILGSYRPADQSWEWAWNNPNARREAREVTRAIKELGVKYGIRYLSDGMVEVPDAEFATFLSAIGTKVLKADGAYYGEADSITYVIALKNLRWQKK